MRDRCSWTNINLHKSHVSQFTYHVGCIFARNTSLSIFCIFCNFILIHRVLHMVSERVSSPWELKAMVMRAPGSFLQSPSSAPTCATKICPTIPILVSPIPTPPSPSHSVVLFSPPASLSVIGNSRTWTHPECQTPHNIPFHLPLQFLYYKWSTHNLNNSDVDGWESTSPGLFNI